ncbi:transcription factor [Seminavis robusta]|uniref:Transcription factor n=1 Tax=Seminavis robusta TaxID=568900 RepID=A0A9N8ESB3_9STRA|nr:transcription factor [Seminavis robusta]|eukprot:Sro1960_g308020.1 transcription factor (150) ;mRNA; r:4053-4929
MSNPSRAQEPAIRLPPTISLCIDAQRQRFPGLLHMVLSRASSGIDPDTEAIVSFQDHGRAFRIHNQEQFCERVLPVLFLEAMSWNDFLEQLRRFGFRRLTNAGPDQGAFYHLHFSHHQPQLAEHIVYNETEIAPLDRPGPNLALIHPTP